MTGVGFLAGLRRKWVPSDARALLVRLFPPIYIAPELERKASGTVSLSSSIHLCLYLVRARLDHTVLALGTLALPLRLRSALVLVYGYLGKVNRTGERGGATNTPNQCI